MPMLNVRQASASGTSPLRTSHVNSAGTSQRRTVDARRRALGQHARHVVGEPAAGDVRHAVDQAVANQRQQRIQVGAVRAQQRLADADPSSGM